MAKGIAKFAASVGLTLLLASSGARPSLSITAELAKKCRELAIKAHPTQRAGTRSSTGEEQRAYFRDCVAKNGDM